MAHGILYVVATPIGNLSDITHRAIEILQHADLIACEDTRRTKNLCSYLQITTPLTSYFREKEQQKGQQLLLALQEGKSIALVSDAGTPAISDPGSYLVFLARSHGIPVITIPGPSAITAAFSISGWQQTQFYFAGFLPAQKSERQKKIKELRLFTCPLLFYEAPHRIAATLHDIQEILQNRKALLFRELTKMHEECLDGTLEDISKAIKKGVKGELVLLVQGSDISPSMSGADLEELLAWHHNELHSTLKDAVTSIAVTFDISKKEVYKLALTIWKD